MNAIGDLPLHPLIVHAVVIGIPLSLLLVVGFVLPRFRPWARWPMAIVVAGSTVMTFLARSSGEGLQHALDIRRGTPVGDLIEQHDEVSGQLAVIMLVLAVVAVASAWLVGTDRIRPGLAILLPVLLVVVAVVAAVWVYRVGDLGARAVWNPSGQIDYSVSGPR